MIRRRGPDRAGRGTKVEDVLPQASLIVIGGSRRSGSQRHLDALTAAQGDDAMQRGLTLGDGDSDFRRKQRRRMKRFSRRASEASSNGALVSSDRAQDRSKAKPDEVVQTPVARLSGRAASRATNAYAVRAAEIVLTH